MNTKDRVDKKLLVMGVGWDPLNSVQLFSLRFFFCWVNLCGSTYLGSLVAGWEMGNLLLPGTSIGDGQCVGLERRGLPDRRDVHPKPLVISCSCVPWLTLALSAYMRTLSSRSSLKAHAPIWIQLPSPSFLCGSYRTPSPVLDPKE